MLGALTVLLVLAGAAFFLTELKNSIQANQQAIAEAPVPVKIPQHVYNDAEKLQALEDFAKVASTSTVSDAEKLRALKSFSAKAPAPILSDEEKRKALLDFATRITLAP